MVEECNEDLEVIEPFVLEGRKFVKLPKKEAIISTLMISGRFTQVFVSVWHILHVGCGQGILKKSYSLIALAL
jgi:hypothetical protein